MVSLPVIWAANSCGHHLEDDGDGARLGDGDRVVDSLLGRVAAALHAEAADPLTLCGVKPMCATTGTPAWVSVAICSATRSPPSSLTAAAPVPR